MTFLNGVIPKNDFDLLTSSDLDGIGTTQNPIDWFLDYAQPFHKISQSFNK